MGDEIMPTFDIVSEMDVVELRHAVDNASREVGTRFDFRGTLASIELKDLTVTLKTESDFQRFRHSCWSGRRPAG